MQKGKGGYIMIPLALLFAEDISQEEKVKKLLDHGKPVLLTELGDGKNDVFVTPKETDDGVLLENVYGYDILVGEEETTRNQHVNFELYLYSFTFNTSHGLKIYSTENKDLGEIATLEDLINFVSHMNQTKITSVYCDGTPASIPTWVSTISMSVMRIAQTGSETYGVINVNITSVQSAEKIPL